ncbi:hypothetical protein [Nitratireductor soli]|uniref:hypothetical protein n=1 Tax=Nitratireductor soli TaxID=1670619 RepID=UPI00069E5922|nr:hypothetical protein [Nitratireductor soli]
MTNIPASGGTIVVEYGSMPEECSADLSQVLVVAASPINRIVLSRIAQRACLKASAMEPGEATRALTAPARDKSPGMVIVDVDANTCTNGALIDWLSEQRSASPRRLPLVIAIISTFEAGSLPAMLFDATVVRPVTPETLQPVIERLIAGAKA